MPMRVSPAAISAPASTALTAEITYPNNFVILSDGTRAYSAKVLAALVRNKRKACSRKVTVFFSQTLTHSIAIFI